MVLIGIHLRQAVRCQGFGMQVVRKIRFDSVDARALFCTLPDKHNVWGTPHRHPSQSDGMRDTSDTRHTSCPAGSIHIINTIFLRISERTYYATPPRKCCVFLTGPILHPGEGNPPEG